MYKYGYDEEALDVLPGETFEQYRHRLYNLKFENKIQVTWTDLAELFFSAFGIQRDESKWRKEAHAIMEDADVVSSDREKQSDILLEIKKERVKLSDERVQNNAYIRRLAREDTLVEIAHILADSMNSKKLLPEYKGYIKDSYAEAIIQISDWHYGLEINNHWNKFNPEICKRRVAELMDEALKFCDTYNVGTIHLVNLSDLIAGRIHQSIRYQSRFDAMTQILDVSEIVAEMIAMFISRGIFVNYYDCLDNHSRLEPIKTDSLDLESLARIVPHYLRARFDKSDMVEIRHNEFSDDIITFEVWNGGYKVAGVHGHKDKPGKVVENLTLMTKRHYDLILTAHLHHFSCDEQNETLIISNGSLMGTDDYAKDLRLTSRPSQNIILVTEDSVADLIHRVTFVE